MNASYENYSSEVNSSQEAIYSSEASYEPETLMSIETNEGLEKIDEEIRYNDYLDAVSSLIAVGNSYEYGVLSVDDLSGQELASLETVMIYLFDEFVNSKANKQKRDDLSVTVKKLKKTSPMLFIFLESEFRYQGSSDLADFMNDQVSNDNAPMSSHEYVYLMDNIDNILVANPNISGFDKILNVVDEDVFFANLDRLKSSPLYPNILDYAMTRNSIKTYKYLESLNAEDNASRQMSSPDDMEQVVESVISQELEEVEEVREYKKSEEAQIASEPKAQKEESEELVSENSSGIVEYNYGNETFNDNDSFESYLSTLADEDQIVSEMNPEVLGGRAESILEDTDYFKGLEAKDMMILLRAVSLNPNMIGDVLTKLSGALSDVSDVGIRSLLERMDGSTLVKIRKWSELKWSNSYNEYQMKIAERFSKAASSIIDGVYQQTDDSEKMIANIIGEKNNGKSEKAPDERSVVQLCFYSEKEYEYFIRQFGKFEAASGTMPRDDIGMVSVGDYDIYFNKFSGPESFTEETQNEIDKLRSQKNDHVLDVLVHKGHKKHFSKTYSSAKKKAASQGTDIVTDFNADIGESNT